MRMDGVTSNMINGNTVVFQCMYDTLNSRQLANGHPGG